MKVTTKNLIKYFPKLNKREAFHIMKLCNGGRDASIVLEGLERSAEAVNRRISECYNRPSDTDIILTAVNVLVGGYGVEGVPYYENAMHDGDYIEYINFGDTYITTILFNPETSQFEISDWGSIYENSPAYNAETGECHE